MRRKTIIGVYCRQIASCHRVALVNEYSAAVQPVGIDTETSHEMLFWSHIEKLWDSIST